jgi:hypothetical protein
MDDETPPDTDELEELVADAELWESGELGNDPETARRSRSPEELAALDASLGLVQVQLGLDEDLHEALKERAQTDGVNLPSVYRAAIAQYLAASSRSRWALGDVGPSDGPVECSFQLHSEDFLELVELSGREDVLPTTAVQAAFEAFLSQ